MTQAKDLVESCLTYEKMLTEGIRVENGYVVLSWGGYEYNIEESRVDTESALLGWVYHLSEKRWMDGGKIRKFIDFVCGIKGIDLTQA